MHVVLKEIKKNIYLFVADVVKRKKVKKIKTKQKTLKKYLKKRKKY